MARRTRRLALGAFFAISLGVLYETCGGLNYRSVNCSEVPEKQPRTLEETYTTIDRYLSEIASSEKIAALLPATDASVEEKLDVLEKLEALDNALAQRISTKYSDVWYYAEDFGIDAEMLGIRNYRQPLWKERLKIVESLDFSALFAEHPESASLVEETLLCAQDVLSDDFMRQIFRDMPDGYSVKERWRQNFGPWIEQDFSDADRARDQYVITIMNRFLDASIPCGDDSDCAESLRQTRYFFLEFEFVRAVFSTPTSEELGAMLDRLEEILRQEHSSGGIAHYLLSPIQSFLRSTPVETLRSKGLFAPLAAFYDRLEASENPELAEAAKQDRGIVRFYDLPGNAMKLEGILTSGELFNPDEYRGKIVYVDFFTTSCGWCIAEFPRMKEIYAKYKERGFEIVGCCCNGAVTPEKIAAYCAQEELPWKTIVNGAAEPNGTLDLRRYYNIRSYPSTVLIGRDGKVVTIDDLRGGKLEQMLEDLTK